MPGAPQLLSDKARIQIHACDKPETVPCPRRPVTALLSCGCAGQLSVAVFRPHHLSRLAGTRLHSRGYILNPRVALAELPLLRSPPRFLEAGAGAGPEGAVPGAVPEGRGHMGAGPASAHRPQRQGQPAPKVLPGVKVHVCPPPTAPLAPGSQSLGQSWHTAHPQLTVRLTPHTSPQRPLARSTFHHWPGCPWPVLGSGLELQRPAWVAGGCLSGGQRVLNGEQTPRLRCRPLWEPVGSQELGVGGLREAHSPAPARERGTEGPPLGPPSAQSRALPTPHNRTCAPDPKCPRAQVGGFHRALGVGGLSTLKEVK